MDGLRARAPPSPSPSVEPEVDTTHEAWMTQDVEKQAVQSTGVILTICHGQVVRTFGVCGMIE